MTSFVSNVWEEHLSFVYNTAVTALVFHISEAVSLAYVIYQLSLI